MNIKARCDSADARDPQYSRFPGVLNGFLFVLILSISIPLLAQGQKPAPGPLAPVTPEAVEELADVVVSLPDSNQVALALATPRSREKTLLNLTVVANMLARAGDQVDLDHAALAQNFLDDRAWLQLLVDRYGWVQPHSSVLDPAAWVVLGTLQQHDLEGMALTFPGRIPKSVLMYQVFQRAGQRLAAANLSVLLLEIEVDVISLWDAFLNLIQSGDGYHAAWKEVETTWFTEQQIVNAAVPDTNSGKHEPGEENILQALSQLALEAIGMSPPDISRLVQLRYSILNHVPVLAEEENTTARDQAVDLLYLASSIDGLHDGRYFEFVRSLISVTHRLMEQPVKADGKNLLLDWLVAELPAVSKHYATEFASVDPRLNAAMAAIYAVLADVASVQRNDTGDIEFDLKAARMVLTDVVAQLALLIPDMGYYFDMPVREKITDKINSCIDIAASQDETGASVMTRRQFDACMQSLFELADQNARLAELSGDMNGPFTIDTLRRELSITSWQRLNYGIGYLHENYPTTCQPPANSLPNPLEWAVLATTMAWFSENAPEFLHTPENENRLAKMRSLGQQLILALSEQAGCLAAVGASINEPVSRSMTDYELVLRELNIGFENAEADFRTQNLRAGADVSLQEDATQKTAYRPGDIVIGPCDLESVCEMSGNLSTTRALIGLFADEYLVAEQTGMGHIEICYRNMEWVQRRSELVRPDDENVANYFGRLGFDLVGRYIENEQASDIFGFRFTSPEEYLYLFAQASEDVLNDACPVEWVGTRIITPIRQSRGGLVPNRLTYLAASRKLPSRLLQNNWDRGAEWRDWFVTGIGVIPWEVPPGPEITTRLNQHLQSLYQQEQAEIFQRVLLPNARNSEGDDVSLFDEMSQVSIAKAMIRMQMMLFYPESLFNSDAIRMAITGDTGLLDRHILRRFREDNVALASVNGIARERLEKFRKDWLKQPAAMRQNGSIPASLMHALTRINVLYRQFFTTRLEPLQEIEVKAKPQLQN